MKMLRSGWPGRGFSLVGAMVGGVVIASVAGHPVEAGNAGGGVAARGSGDETARQARSVTARAAGSENAPEPEAVVIPAPRGFRYELVQVTFAEPRRISDGAGQRTESGAIKVLIQGRDFRPADTGPVVSLNGQETMRTTVSEDGNTVHAWFFGESIQSLEAAAKARGGWELTYLPHAGAGKLYRVSPTGKPADGGRRPEVRRGME